MYTNHLAEVIKHHENHGGLSILPLMTCLAVPSSYNHYAELGIYHSHSCLYLHQWSKAVLMKQLLLLFSLSSSFDNVHLFAYSTNSLCSSISETMLRPGIQWLVSF